MSIDQSQSLDGTAFPAGPDGEPPGLLADGESAASASELKYQRLVEGIGGDYVIYTHDPDGRITYVSPSIENALGFPARAVLGLNWRDLIGEQFIGRDSADRVAADVAAGKKFYNFTVEIMHADGETRLIEIQQRPLFDADGQYISMEGIAKDITQFTRNAQELHKLKQELERRVADRTAELIRSNERLRESETRYRTVVDCQTDFVVRWMPGGFVTFVNESYCRLVGRTHDELIGWSFVPTIHAEDEPAFQEMIAKLDKDHPIADFENRIVAPDGSTRWTHWTNQMLFDEEGNFLEYQSVGRDTTELKNAADTIREKENHLAHMSRLATMGELVAGVAHEIHQPLHAAKTFSEAARRNLEMGAPKNIEIAIECTKEISTAITRTATIIRRLREFTRSGSVCFEQIDLNRIVSDAATMIAFETRKAEVMLTLDCAVDLPTLRGDRVQLEQACINLMINAFEAMAETPEAERTLIISTQFGPQKIRVSFRDTGCGVATEDMDSLFDAFYTTKQHGMGMGLSLCKSIAEAHGGRIWGQGNEGSGMTFVLELPIPQRPASNSSMTVESNE